MNAHPIMLRSILNTSPSLAGFIAYCLQRVCTFTIKHPSFPKTPLAELPVRLTVARQKKAALMISNDTTDLIRFIC